MWLVRKQWRRFTLGLPCFWNRMALRGTSGYRIPELSSSVPKTKKDYVGEINYEVDGSVCQTYSRLYQIWPPDSNIITFTPPALKFERLQLFAQQSSTFLLHMPSQQAMQWKKKVCVPRIIWRQCNSRDTKKPLQKQGIPGIGSKKKNSCIASRNPIKGGSPLVWH